MEVKIMLWWILILVCVGLSVNEVRKDGLDEENVWGFIVGVVILLFIIIYYTEINDVGKEKDSLLKTYNEVLEIKDVSELYTLERDVIDINKRIASQNEKHYIIDALFFLKNKVEFVSIEELVR